jgi:hypothetical protein
MNAPGLHAKITSDSGLPARLAASNPHPRQVAEDLYLRTFSRFPADDEMKLVAEVLDEAKDSRGRRTAIEDLLWALINTPEFLYKD